MEKEIILVTGGSGLVGSVLVPKLVDAGYDVRILSRTPRPIPGATTFFCDFDRQAIDKKALVGVSHIIHLVGANIADKRWTKLREKVLYQSRVRSAQFILECCFKENQRIKTMVSASAIGVYGFAGPEVVFDETSHFSPDFVGSLCREWENAADGFSLIGARVVKLRLGLILSRKGGIVKKLTTFIKLGLGVVLGNGKQYMPWIHIDDVASFVLQALTDSTISSTYNLVAPQYTTNAEFTRKLALVLNKKLVLPNVPSFVLRLFFGKMSALLVKGNMIEPVRLKEMGFEWKYDDIDEAFKQLLDN